MITMNVNMKRVPFCIPNCFRWHYMFISGLRFCWFKRIYLPINMNKWVELQVLATLITVLPIYILNYTYLAWLIINTHIMLIYSI